MDRRHRTGANTGTLAPMDTWGTTAIAWLMSLLGAAAGGTACLDLAMLDLRRSLAYAEASPADLAELFVDESVATSDLEVLKPWLERGYTFESVMLVIGTCTLVDELPGEQVRLRVVDRLAPTVAVAPDRARIVLPIDGWSEREIVLHRIDGTWRYAGGT